MNFFFKILILFRWVKVDSQQMNHWFLMNNKNIILFILKKGVFQERLLAIETLKKFKDESIIPDLLRVARKDYEEIAMKALDLASSLDEKRLYTSEIEEIKLAWERKIEKKKGERENKESKRSKKKRAKASSHKGIT